MRKKDDCLCGSVGMESDEVEGDAEGIKKSIVNHQKVFTSEDLVEKVSE